MICPLRAGMKARVGAEIRRVPTHVHASFRMEVKSVSFGVLLFGGAAEEPWNLWFRLSAPCRFFSPLFLFSFLSGAS